jgi:hypothetical protein
MLVGEKKVGEILVGEMQVGEKTWSVKLKVGEILGHQANPVTKLYEFKFGVLIKISLNVAKF